MAMPTEITLGSGKLYLTSHTAGEEIDLSTLCVEANQIGAVSGGATLSYKPTIYSVESDLKEVVKRFITSEEITLKSGVITFDLTTLHNIIGNNKMTTDSTSKKTTVKLGNPGAVEQEEMVVGFEHTKTDGTVIRIGMVATNNDGLELAFTKDAATQIDATFSAVPANVSDGVLCLIEWDESGKTA